jgi:hypothetical protein
MNILVINPFNNDDISRLTFEKIYGIDIANKVNKKIKHKIIMYSLKKM